MARLFAVLALCALLAPAQAMGPDPGGKTGAGVTPESTRTDHPQGDKALDGTGARDAHRAQAGSNHRNGSSGNGQAQNEQLQSPRK